jgi:surface polysaccharide O-acyltransferase-like enzyme
VSSHPNASIAANRPFISRDTRIDTLRGLACLLLVAYHAIGGSSTDGMRVADDSLWREFSNLLSPVRMPLFAFITGMLLTDAIATFRQARLHIVKRIVRLGLPLLFVVPAFELLACAAGSKFCVGNPFYGVVMPYAHFWFLQSSLLIAVLIALALIPFRGNLKIFALAALPASFAIFLFAPEPRLDVFSVSGVAYLLPFTILGIAAREHGHLLGLRTAFITICLAAIVACFYAVNWHDLSSRMLVGSMVRIPDRLLLSTAAVLFLFSLGLRNTFLTAIGRYAFAIYLFHPIFSSASRRLFESAGFDHSGFPMFALDLFAGVAFPILLQKILFLDHRAALVFLGESRSRKRLSAKPT